MEQNARNEGLLRQSDIAPVESLTERESPPAETARKAYTRPQLVEHGRMRALTSADAAPSTVPSDRNLKEHFESVDPRAILAEVTRLPIARWSYKGEAVRHLGPMAQDFAAAFGLGADDHHIFPLDATGVALAAIQGLRALAQAQQARLEVLERELAVLRGDSAALRAELAAHEGPAVVRVP